MSNEVKPITLKNIKMINKKFPLILNNKIILKKKLMPYDGPNLSSTKNYREDLIYETKSGGFLYGDLQEVTIVNRLDKTNNTCRTLARCKTHNGTVYERTSDDITKLIGQNNYDIVFSALCSVINQELKIRGIYSLLSVSKSATSVSCQTEVPKNNSSCPVSTTNNAHMYCQTDESFIDTYKKKMKMRQRTKRTQLAPYVIQDTKKPRRLVIEPNNFECLLKSTSSLDEESQKSKPDLPELGLVFGDDCNSSVSSNGLTISTTPSLIMNPIRMLDKVIERPPEVNNKDYKLHNLDSPKQSESINKQLPLNQVLNNIPRVQRIKVLLQQAQIDWAMCLQPDESGHLPIHLAVLNNDLDLLKRQLLVLKMKGISVDIEEDNLTPLKRSLYQDSVEMTTLLLEHNADPLDSDLQDQTCFHIAAGKPTDHLQALVNHCQHNARKLLEDNEELWKQEYAMKTDEELAKILLRHIGRLYNSDGYTPLMLACKAGRYENIKMLVESCPESVNYKMPNSGNTPLFVAVSSACMDATDRGNKSKVVDHFRKSIEILVDNGADPNLNNFNGTNVNDLLQDYNIGDLSMLVANKLTSKNISNEQIPISSNNFDQGAYMLVKEKDGKLNLKTLDKKPKRGPRSTKSTKKSTVIQNVPTPKSTPTKPLIIKSETITGNTAIPISNTNTGTIQNMEVQNFKLNQPLILRQVRTPQNKRKFEMSVEPTNKKNNTND